jgi:hypothetical protein
MDIFATVSSTDAGLKAIQEAVKELKRHEVVIGIPEEKNATHEGGKATNAELLFIHTHGSPARRIPSRPVLEPAISHNKEQIVAELKKAIDAAVAGKKESVVPALKKAGSVGEKVAKGWFNNPSNGWAKNSDVTIYGSNEYIRDGEKRPKTYKKKVRGEDGIVSEVEVPYKLPENPFIKGKGSKRPLIAIGEMRGSIIYVVREV